jgi:hypothetical protein
VTTTLVYYSLSGGVTFEKPLFVLQVMCLVVVRMLMLLMIDYHGRSFFLFFSFCCVCILVVFGHLVGAKV